VTTKTGGREDENDRVHDRHEKEDGDQATDTGHARKCADEYTDTGAGKSVCEEEKRSRDDRQEGGTDEAGDGEGDEGVRKELRTLLLEDPRGFTCCDVSEYSMRVQSLLTVVEEEGSNGHLGTDIQELSDETSDGAVLISADR
jgi:hypothetical protein